MIETHNASAPRTDALIREVFFVHEEYNEANSFRTKLSSLAPS
jgi:hypothetical protein